MLKRRIANWLLKYLYNAVTEDDILKWDGKNLTLNGTALSADQIRELQGQAEVIQTMDLWKMFNKEFTHTAQELLFNKSQTTDDMMFPKAVLYVLDVFDKKFTNLRNIQT